MSVLNLAIIAVVPKKAAAAVITGVVTMTVKNAPEKVVAVIIIIRARNPGKFKLCYEHSCKRFFI